MKRKLLFPLAVFCCFGFQSGSRAAVYPTAFSKTSAAASPYNLVGKLNYRHGGSGYQASGTVIKPKSVLTAAHALYDPATGFSQDVSFARINAGTDVPTSTAAKIYVLGGYREAATLKGKTSDAAFSKDVGGIVFPETLAGGKKASWSGNYSMLMSPWYLKVSTGFAAEQPNNGQRLTYVSAASNYYRRSGMLFANNSVYFASGMSGGPTFCRLGKQALVTGVIVAGAKSPKTMGAIRAFDWSMGTFIKRYLP